DITAGLRLTGVQDLLEVARRTSAPVTRKAVLDSVNDVLETQLGDIIQIIRPEHGVKDLIGPPELTDIFQRSFDRCEDSQTAISAILVVGPNGGGKTYRLEGHAADCGRVVIELTGLRGMYFGQTDKFFELLRWHIRTF